MPTDFEDQFIAAVHSIQRIVVNSIDPNEAMPHLLRAVANVARAIALPKPIDPTVVQTIEECLKHTTDEFAALSRADSRPDAEMAFVTAQRHRMMTAALQEKLRTLLRGKEKMMSEDVAWVESLVTDDTVASMEWVDARKDGEAFFKRAQKHVANRSRVKPIRAESLELVPSKIVDRRVETKRFVSALLNYSRAPRLSRMSRLSLADNTTTTASALLVISGAVALLGGSSLWTYSNYRSDLNIPIVDEKTILKKCVAEKGFLEWLQSAVSNIFAGSARSRKNFTDERLDVIKCWVRQVNQNNGTFEEGTLIYNFFASGIERLTETNALNYDQALEANRNYIMILRAQGVPNLPPITVTPFGNMRIKQIATMQKIEKLFNDNAIDIQAGGLTPALIDAYSTMRNEFDQFVAEEINTLRVYGWNTEMVGKINSLNLESKKETKDLEEPSPLPSQVSIPTPPVNISDAQIQSAANQTALLPAVILDNKQCVAFNVNETNMESLFNKALDKAQNSTQQIVTVPVNDDGEKPAEVEGGKSYEVDGVTITNEILANDVARKLLGEYAIVHKFVPPNETNITGNTTEGLANMLYENAETGETRAANEPITTDPLESIFDGFVMNGGLGKGLASRHPPNRVMRYFAGTDKYEEAALKYFVYLYRYVQLIGYVSPPKSANAIRMFFGSNQAEQEVISFGKLVSDAFANANSAKRYGIEYTVQSLLTDIKNVPGNENVVFDSDIPDKLPSLPTDRSIVLKMLNYIDTFIQTAYTVDLMCYWHFGLAISRVRQQNDLVLKLGKSSDVPADILPTLTSRLTETVRAVYKDTCATSHARAADLYTAVQISLGEREAESNPKLVSREVNGAMFSPNLKDKTVVMQFATTDKTIEELEKEPPQIDYSLADKRQSYQYVYAIRDTEACIKDNTSLEKCPWTVVNNATAFELEPGRERQDVIIANVGRAQQQVALLSIFDNASKTYGPTLAAFSVAATRAVAGSNAKVNSVTAAMSAASTMASASANPEDDSGTIAMIKRLLTPLETGNAGWFKTFTDPLTNVYSAMEKFLNFYSSDASTFRTLLSAFSSLSHLGGWLEVAIKFGGVVLTGARLLNAYTGCCDWLVKIMHRWLAGSVGRMIGAVSENAPTDPSNVEASRQRKAQVEEAQQLLNRYQQTTARADVLKSLNMSQSDLDALGPNPRITVINNATRIVSSAEAAVTEQVWEGLTKCCGNCCGVGLSKVVALTKLLVSLVMKCGSKLVSVVSSICGFSVASTTDSLYTLLNAASIAMIVVASPAIASNSLTFAQTIAISLTAQVGLQSVVDYVATLLTNVMSKVTSNKREEVRRVWRDMFIIGGLIGVRVAPWLIGLEWSAIAQTSKMTAPMKAVFDPVYRSSISSVAAQSLSDDDVQLQLAVMAGSAVARIWAPKVIGLMRHLASGQQISLDESVELASVAFSDAFINAAKQNDLLKPEWQKASNIWADVCIIAISTTPQRRLQPTNEKQAHELLIVGANFIEFIRTSGVVYYDVASLTALRNLDANGEAYMFPVAQNISRLFNNTRAALPAITAAMRGVSKNKMLHEFIAIYGERMREK